MKRTIQFVSFEQSRSLIPFLIGGMLVAFLTSVVYTGGKRENLAAISEAALIGLALKLAIKPAEYPLKVASVTFQDDDLQYFPEAQFSSARDVDINSYARILDKVLKQSKATIMMTWVPGAHPLEWEHFKPVLEVIEQNSAVNRTYLLVPPSYYQSADPELLKRYQFIEGEDCAYRINLYCSIPANWKTWPFTIMAKRLWTKRKSLSLSYNLPHVFPNVLVNLPRPESLNDIKPSELLVLSQHPKITKETALITIGPDISQALIFADNKNEIQKTFYAASNLSGSLRNNGLPYHKFWVGLGYMFVSGTTISVAPLWVNLLCAGLLCTFILFLMINYGSGFSLLGYLLITLIYCGASVISTRFLSFYIPFFHVAYVGLITVVTGSFFEISRTLIRHYSVSAERQKNIELLDLKQNFISLISHNLNTPVAKLRGLVDLLALRPIFKIAEDLVNDTRFRCLKIQLIVRFVLLSSSLEQRSFMRKNLSPGELAKDLFYQLKSYSDLLGIKLKTELGADVVPSRNFDSRYLIHALIGLLYQNYAVSKEVHCGLYCNESTGEWIVRMKDVGGGFRSAPESTRDHRFVLDLITRFLKDCSKQDLLDYKVSSGVVLLKIIEQPAIEPNLANT